MSANSTEKNETGGSGDAVAPTSQPTPNKGWVHFDEENPTTKESEPAVISTESVQVNLERSINSLPENNVGKRDTNRSLKNVELPVAMVEPIRQGFCKFMFLQ